MLRGLTGSTATGEHIIARTGVGVGLVDVVAASVRGIPVVITPHSGSRAVAEGVFAMALHLTKRLRPLTELVRDGQWAERSAVPVGDLDGATLGIVGYGRIGRRVGELADGTVRGTGRGHPRPSPETETSRTCHLSEHWVLPSSAPARWARIMCADSTT
ncbi:NAD(P)-dependent oxidoreductase [Streptomyces mirabilis]